MIAAGGPPPTPTHHLPTEKRKELMKLFRYVRGISFDAAAPSYHRAVAMNVLAAPSAAPELRS